MALWHSAKIAAERIPVRARGVQTGMPRTLNHILYEMRHAAEKNQALDAPVQVHGWIASMRKQKTRNFMELSDGTLGGSMTLQAMLVGDAEGLAPGVAVRLHGRMRPGRGTKKDQSIEMHVDTYTVLAPNDLATYPLAHLMNRSDRGDPAHFAAAEIVRRESHWKPRTARYGAVSRTRSRMESAMGAWFEENDYVKVHPPVITSSDCEGGGEIFRVVAEADAGKQATPHDLSAFWSHHSAFLSVSTQLHLEAFALGLSRVWALTPVFRAEGSSTNRHLAEFWMCEAELCWIPQGTDGLSAVMDCVEGVIKAAVYSAVGRDSSIPRHRQRAEEDMQLLLDAPHPEQVLAGQAALDTAWPRITYTDAVRILGMHHHTVDSSDRFEIEPVWGDALRSEHERWLADRAGTPVFVTDYPAKGKPFYMRENAQRVRLTDGLAPGHEHEERETVACFDLLVPHVGEIAGGSLREEREEVLAQRMRAQNVAQNDTRLSWYKEDLRRYGGAPHGGFGLGVERLLSWITHTENVRDIVAFPRVKGPLRY
ncbi:asparagine--tRNA ligase [Malassezia vespertilionis]|uniref:asparagine--tRNA ligase n=1 Tax=Malassezia vespertilionis TaxID=2020962 RepID=A0A2N1JEJ5_9BASI|nr:asparagine--tRNA ligase [Malassezia vespertilionis]PKI84972.1 Slm5p [Malassezia vespertilionis]WFD05983.1 asparagine--tRNA ligase [Malassezia vespertilionis]